MERFHWGVVVWAVWCERGVVDDILIDADALWRGEGISEQEMVEGT